MEQNKMENKEEMNLVEGIAVSGEAIEQRKDKTFTIAKGCYYTTFTDDQGKEKKKLVIPVKLSDGIILDYFPNKTSIKTLVRRFDFDMNKWIGQKAEWEVSRQKIQGVDKFVLYVK